MRPLLIGMNNPLSLQPGHELYPLPVGCTGHRLWCMLDDAHRAARGSTLYPREYLVGFERRNLVVGRAWDKTVARCSANEISLELMGSGRHVVLLGREVQTAFGLPPTEPCQWRAIGGIVFYAVPHPSGRNLFYNDPSNRRRVGELLLRLYAEGCYNNEGEKRA